MARTTAELAEQLARFLPASVAEGLDPLVGGAAAALQVALEGVDDLELLVDFVTTAADPDPSWLDLHADGYGIYRLPGETSEGLLTRLQNVDDALTPVSILAAVNALLAPYTATEAVMLEWWDEPYLADDGKSDDPILWLDHSYWSGGTRTFLILVPIIADSALPWGSYLGHDTYLGHFYWGIDSGEHPVYHAIVAEVERLRAAGIAWRLVYSDQL